MKLEQTFEVGAPVERVWQALIDVEQVAPCLPGAAVTGRNEDGSYNGTFSVKIGPTSASYSGKLVMEQVDEQSHTATMQAQGTDKRGQGGAKATIVSSVVPADGGGAKVEVNTDYHITGRLARFGRGGMIEDISERLLREFAQRLAASLDAGGDEAEPAPPDSEAGVTEGEGSDGEGEGSDGEGEGSDGEGDEDQPGEAPAATEPAPEARPSFTPPPPAEPLDAGSLVGSVVADRVRRNPLPLVAGFVLLVLLGRRRRRRRRR